MGRCAEWLQNQPNGLLENIQARNGDGVENNGGDQNLPAEQAAGNINVPNHTNEPQASGSSRIVVQNNSQNATDNARTGTAIPSNTHINARQNTLKNNANSIPNGKKTRKNRTVRSQFLARLHGPLLAENDCQMDSTIPIDTPPPVHFVNRYRPPRSRRTHPTKKPLQLQNVKYKNSYSSYVKRVLKQIHGNVGIGITKESLHVMDSFLNDIFCQIVTEAINLITISNTKTLREKEIEYAVRLIIPGHLCRHAINVGKDALIRLKAS